MALRYATKFTYAASVGGGGVLTHGLGATPDEVILTPCAALGAAASMPYLITASQPDSVALYVSMGLGMRFSAFAAVNHSIIQ